MPFKALVSIYFYTKMNFILGATDFILSLGNELPFENGITFHRVESNAYDFAFSKITK